MTRRPRRLAAQLCNRVRGQKIADIAWLGNLPRTHSRGRGRVNCWSFQTSRIMHDGEKLRDGCGGKRAIHVANRYPNKLHRVSALRHNRHDRRYAASLSTFHLSGARNSQLILTAAIVVGWRSAAVARGGAPARGVPAACGSDAGSPRPDRVRHAMFEMVMARASAIACGYEDAIDLDRLRHDPLMKVAVGRCPETGAPLASQSTISRLENAPSKDRGGAAVCGSA